MSKKRKRNPLIAKVAMVLIFLIGCLIMFYPFYIDALNSYLDEIRLENFQKKEASEYRAQQKALLEKNEQLKESGLEIGADPFDETVTQSVSQEEYDQHLLGTIDIPKLALNIPLFDTTTAGLLEVGATVLNGTSQPVGGESTHSVITGHRGLPQRELFTNIPKLVMGDSILLNVLGETLAYEVSDIRVVEPHETASLKIQDKQDLITLVTCTPYMINSHRLLVTGKRVPYTPAIAKVATQGKKVRKWKQMGILVGTVLLIIASLGLIIRLIYLERLKKYRFDLDLTLEGTTATFPKDVTLYNRKGTKPLMRDGKVFRIEPDQNGRIRFEDLPGGLYQLRFAGEKGRLKAGIKKKGQKPQIYSRKSFSNFSIKPTMIVA